MAEEISLRLAELGALLREGRAAEAGGRLLAAGFQGGALSSRKTRRPSTRAAAFEVHLARAALSRES